MSSIRTNFWAQSPGSRVDRFWWNSHRKRFSWSGTNLGGKTWRFQKSHFIPFLDHPTVHGRSARRVKARVRNGLDQSAGFIIQSSPGGFGLDWIRNLPTQRILDWNGSRNVQCAFPSLIFDSVSPYRNSDVRSSTPIFSVKHILVCYYMYILRGI